MLVIRHQILRSGVHNSSIALEFLYVSLNFFMFILYVYVCISFSILQNVAETI